MLQAFNGLSRTGQLSGTAPAHIRFALLIHFAYSRGPAFRASLRHLPRRAAAFAVRIYNGHNLRDNIACPLQHDRVAYAHILALNLILIVQRRIRDNHAANRDRFQPRNRRERSGAANLNINRLKQCCCFFSGKFMGNGPTRRAADKAEAVLPVKPVNLVDDPVNIIAQARALAFNISISG